MAYKSLIVNARVQHKTTCHSAAHKNSVKIFRVEDLLQSFWCRVAVIKGVLNPGRRDNVKLWRLQSGVRTHLADVMPAVIGAEAVRCTRIVVDVHARMPRSNGMSSGVARSPVARSLRRGTPTSAVNTPLV